MTNFLVIHIRNRFNYSGANNNSHIKPWKLELQLLQLLYNSCNSNLNENPSHTYRDRGRGKPYPTRGGREDIPMDVEKRGGFNSKPEYKIGTYTF